MDNKEADILAVLAKVSHERFNIKEFKPTFIKSFLHVSKTQCASSLDRKDAAGLALILFTTLFINRPTMLEPVLKKLAGTMKSTATIDGFLSTLFFIFLHHYSKSFFSRPKSWKKFIQVTEALDGLIELSVTEFKPLTIKSSSLPPDDLAITALEKIRRNKGTIMVLNTYRSVPIQYKAHVVHTSADTVLIKTHSLQQIAASFQGGIYILKDGELDVDLYASVRRRIVQGHDLLELSRFDQLSNSFHKRQTVRVHPIQSFTLVVRYEGNSYILTLFDISIGGLSAIANREIPLNDGEEVLIRLPADLLEAREPLEINADFLHRSLFEGGFKYHFQFTLDSAEENSISRMIVKRQNIIIRDLKEQVL